MLSITSKQNGQLKLWRKLLTAKGRKQSQQYLIEGAHLVEEAIQSAVNIKYIIYSDKYLKTAQPFTVKQSVTQVRLDDSLMGELSQTQTSQGVFAVVEISQQVVEIKETYQRILLLDSVQDPGNLGTLIRTADAANYDLVVLGEGTVDVYNDKVIRATQGSIWHLPIVQANLSALIEQLKQQQFNVYATALHQTAIDYKTIEKQSKVAILLGNEGNGVAEALIQQASASIYIPMPGKAESLNVAVAGGILMFSL